MGIDMFGWIEVSDWMCKYKHGNSLWRGVVDLKFMMPRDHSVQFFFAHDHTLYELWPEADMRYPTMKSRGFPSDLSYEVQSIVNDDLFDGFCTTHIYYHELEDNLLKYGWNETLKRCRMNDEDFRLTNVFDDNHQVTKDEYINKYLEKEMEDPYNQVSEDYNTMLNVLKIIGEYLDHTKIRLILWESP